MNIELGILSDGKVMLVSDRPLPDMIRRVEYYGEQRLFTLVFDNPALEDALMHYDIPSDMAPSVEKAPHIMIYSLFPDYEPIGYTVPLVMAGEKTKAIEAL